MAEPLIHGGDWAGYRAEFGENAPLLDFSANVSPLGVPAGVRAALADAAQGADRYPDPLCRALCAALAEAESAAADTVVCGSGAADLIWRLGPALRPRRALVPAPTFAEYEAALRAAGCAAERYFLLESNDFALTGDFLRRIAPGVDLVFLCEPNNPTGVLSDPALVRAAAARCRAAGALLVLDACFLDFTGAPLPVRPGPGVLVLKAFTKLYAMAGVRLGYALCPDAAFAAALRAAAQPWAVSTPAQAAGLAALKERAYVEAVLSLVNAERPRLAAGLRALGLRVVPGRANYLLFRCETPLLASLRQRGILVRGCGNYAGLDDAWYRAAVRTHDENDALLRAISEVIG